MSSAEIPNRIDEIRARHTLGVYKLGSDDVAFLLASVDRMTLILNNVQNQASTLQIELDRLQTEGTSDDDRG